MFDALALALRAGLGRLGPGRRKLGLEPADEGHQVASELLAEVSQLEGIQTPDPTFDIADKGLGATQSLRQIILGNPCAHPQLPQATQKNLVFGAVDGLGHGHVLTSWPAKLYSIFRYRSEEHTSELQSLMRISYAVF